MLQYVIPLIGSFFTQKMFLLFMVPLLGLCFLATLPCLIRMFWRD